MASTGGGGGGGVDLQKLSLCYSKLFQQQAHFAAEQASMFAKLAAGDDAVLDAVLKMPDPSVKAEDGEGGKGKGKGGRKRKQRDEDAPKRPKSGYQLYLIERMSLLKQENPEKQQKEIMSMLADEWKSLNPAKKQKYTEAAEKEKGKYKVAVDAYNKSKNGGGTAVAAAPAAAVAAADAAKAGGEETESDAGGSGEHKKKKKKHKKHKHHKKDRSE